MSDAAPYDLERSVAELAAALFADPSTPAETLRRIVELAVETVSGCEFAGILAAEPGKPGGLATATATAEIVLELHRLQAEAGHGPCLEAVETRTPCYVTDLTTDRQWPSFAEGAVALGIRSVLAYPLASSARSSALNLYAPLPVAFGATDRARGLLLAVFAGLAMDAADAQAKAERREEHLRTALQSRELIGQAQGILMERERITGEQAFALLRDSSQHLNMKLREVAQALIETGETPATDRLPGAGAR